VHRVAAERPRAQRACSRVVRDLGQQGRIDAALAAAQRGGGQHGDAVEAPCEVGEEAQRRPVAPVQIVDRQQERPGGGQVEREPVEPVQRGELRAGLAVRRLLAREHGGGRRSGAGQRLLRPRRHVGLEQLAHDAERELALELRGAGGEHAQLGTLAQTGQQARLADPGRTLDQHQPPAAGDRVRDEAVERGDLTIAVQQRHGASASGSSRRERIPSLRYALERWTSTVFGVT
jgi:hypothetical protein